MPIGTRAKVASGCLTRCPRRRIWRSVDGDIGQAATADKVAQTAIGKFGSINHVVNNAGIFAAKSFTDYSIDEFRRFVSTNLEGLSSSPNSQSSRCCHRVRAAA